MRISGNVRDAKSKEPLEGVKLTFSVEKIELASFYSDVGGFYEHSVAEDYIGQILTCIAKKEGYESKTVTYIIEESDIHLDIELIPEPLKPMKIHGAIIDSKTKEPLEGVKITLGVEAVMLETLESKSDGSFEYLLAGEYIGKTLNFIIKKEGYEDKTERVEIEEGVIPLNFELSTLTIRLSGTVKDAKSNNPLKSVKFRLSYDGVKLDIPDSDQDGRYEGFIPYDYLGKTLKCKVERRGYKSITTDYEIAEKDITREILLEKKFPWWIFLVLGLLILVGLASLFILVDNVPPEVSIKSDISSPTTSDKISFSAVASDKRSGIETIVIYLNDKEVKKCSESPCVYEGGPYSGKISFYAKASDKKGNEKSTGKNYLDIKDIEPPTVWLTFTPRNPTKEDKVRFTATASDPSGIETIVIVINGKELKCLESPCVYEGGPYTEGRISFYAKAWDKKGNEGSSETKIFTVGQKKDINPPTLSITFAPPNPTKEDKVTFTATASDPSGISKIDIQVNARTMKICTSSPCVYEGGPYPEGSVSYGANSYDKAGNRVSTGSKSFRVGAGAGDTTPPKIKLDISVGEVVSVVATVEDPSGIEKINILVNGFIRKTCKDVTTCIYSTNFETPFKYKAIAWDKAGNKAETETRSI